MTTLCSNLRGRRHRNAFETGNLTCRTGARRSLRFRAFPLDVVDGWKTAPKQSRADRQTPPSHESRPLHERHAQRDSAYSPTRSLHLCTLVFEAPVDRLSCLIFPLAFLRFFSHSRCSHFTLAQQCSGLDVCFSSSTSFQTVYIESLPYLFADERVIRRVPTFEMSTYVATPRQPFAVLDSPRLQHLTSLKNRQNGMLYE